MLRVSASATPDELIAFTRERLPAGKTPKHVNIVEQLPKNPSGKILKRDSSSRLRPMNTEGDGRGGQGRRGDRCCLGSGGSRQQPRGRRRTRGDDRQVDTDAGSALATNSEAVFLPHDERCRPPGPR
ncbi:MAG: hypothetical protein R2710_25120 [Acidimicrobiales bacterium]